MPELPEVELVTRYLEKLIAGERFNDAQILREKLAPQTSPDEFSSVFRGSCVTSVRRRGKHILIGLSNGMTLIVHLRMSGRFMLLPMETENPKFTHAIFYLEGERKLLFQDQRHFGFMKIVATDEVFRAKELTKLAPEPFSEEFSQTYFREALKGSKRSLKDFLLDQTKVSGLGNIYAAEAMFLSRLHPEVRTNEVSTIKANRLRKHIIGVLRESIDYSSTLNINPENFEESYYGGDYENQWRVYDREGKPCPKCSTKIRRIKQNGRSSFFCPRCQRK